MTTTAVTVTVATEVATTSAPHESLHPHGRPGDGAAASRTEELFAQHGRMVSGLCRGLLRNQAESEDAAQQTFLSAHRALLGGTDPREPAAWLATIARNECLARIRSRMREPLPVDQLETASLTYDPLAEAIRRADLAALWVAIKALPVQQRDALLLREFGGLRYDELATALGVSEPAVESLLFRARTRLRGQLRTAYASLTGASWLEAAARLFAGGSAPVAAKVAALGVGAAAVTGGAVVAPHVLDNHHRPPLAPHRAPAVQHVTPTAVKASVAAVVPMAAPPKDVSGATRHRGRPPVVSSPAEDRSGSDDNSGDDRSGKGSRGDESGKGSAAAPAETERSGRHRGESSGSGDSKGSDEAERSDESSGSSSDSGGSSGSGHGDSGESGHGGGDDSRGGGDEDVVPAPLDPAVTVPAAPVLPVAGGG